MSSTIPKTAEGGRPKRRSGGPLSASVVALAAIPAAVMPWAVVVTFDEYVGSGYVALAASIAWACGALAVARLLIPRFVSHARAAYLGAAVLELVQSAQGRRSHEHAEAKRLVRREIRPPISHAWRALYFAWSVGLLIGASEIVGLWLDEPIQSPPWSHRLPVLFLLVLACVVLAVLAYDRQVSIYRPDPRRSHLSLTAKATGVTLTRWEYPTSAVCTNALGVGLSLGFAPNKAPGASAAFLLVLSALVIAFFGMTSKQVEIVAHLPNTRGLSADIQSLLPHSGRRLRYLNEEALRSFFAAHFQPRAIPPAADRRPRRIGPYSVKAVLGRGGMGTVYLARRFRSRGHVAIKVMAIDMDQHSERARFGRESRVMQRVDHTHVVRIIGRGTTSRLGGRRPYIVMEYVDGHNLAEYVSQFGPLEYRILVPFALTLADSLVALHEEEIVHADVKPKNIIVASHGPVLVDLGISRGADMTRITLTGERLVSSGYTAPEVVNFAPPTQSSDVWSWGSVVYYAATGRNLVAGSSLREILDNTLLVDHSARARSETSLQTLADAVSAAVQRNPDDRPQNGSELFAVVRPAAY